MTAEQMVSGNKSACQAGFHIYNSEDADRLFKGRDLYIWGAGQKGRGFKLALERNGFKVKAFLDNSPLLAGNEYCGLNIFQPQTLLNSLAAGKTCFILVASTGNNIKDIFAQCQQAGLVKGIDYINIQELAPYYPTVEVSGVCNLECMSCPRGSLTRQEKNAGFMSSNDYARVIRKLIDEIPFLYLVDLYIWGDPVLNPELAEIIKINSELGIASGISTNLNDSKYLEDIVKAAPGQIRVSVSGFGAENYEVTHTGGKWERLYANLILLHELIEKHRTRTIVEIYYHAYKNNIAESRHMIEFCNNHGFRFHPVLSMLFPDFALQFCEGNNLPEKAKRADELMLINMEKLIEDAAKDKGKGCLLNRVLPVIHWDMSVMPCCNYSYHKLAENYLDITLDEIIRLRSEHPLCITCQKHALHRYFNPERYSGLVKSVLVQV